MEMTYHQNVLLMLCTWKILMTLWQYSFSYHITNSVGIFAKIKVTALLLDMQLDHFYVPHVKRTATQDQSLCCKYRVLQYTASDGADHCKWPTSRFTVHSCTFTLHYAWTDEKSCVDHKMEWRGFLVSATDVPMDQWCKDKRDPGQPSHNVGPEGQEFWRSARTNWKYRAGSIQIDCRQLSGPPQSAHSHKIASANASSLQNDRVPHVDRNVLLSFLFGFLSI
jgi:hypothetical protein